MTDRAGTRLLITVSFYMQWCAEPQMEDAWGAVRELQDEFGPLVCKIMSLVVLSNKRGLNPELCAWCAKRTHGRTEKATLTPNVTRQASTQLSGL